MVCRGYGSWGLGVGLTKTSISTLTKGLYGDNGANNCANCERFYISSPVILACRPERSEFYSSRPNFTGLKNWLSPKLDAEL